MTALESTILDAFVRGDNEELGILREQNRQASVRGREYTGVGFFTYFAVAASAPRLRNHDRLVMSDVGADIDPLVHGAGFLLFVKDGAIDCLEGFTYGEEWPPETRLRRWYYLRQATPSSASLIETTERDLAYALSRRVG